MKKNSFRIALAALSCALATLFVALLGVNTSFAFVLGYVCGSVCLMLPLAKEYRQVYLASPDRGGARVLPPPKRRG